MATVTALAPSHPFKGRQPHAHERRCAPDPEDWPRPSTFRMADVPTEERPNAVMQEGRVPSSSDTTTLAAAAAAVSREGSPREMPFETYRQVRAARREWYARVRRAAHAAYRKDVERGRRWCAAVGSDEDGFDAWLDRRAMTQGHDCAWEPEMRATPFHDIRCVFVDVAPFMEPVTRCDGCVARCDSGRLDGGGRYWFALGAGAPAFYCAACRGSTMALGVLGRGDNQAPVAARFRMDRAALRCSRVSPSPEL